MQRVGNYIYAPSPASESGDIRKSPETRCIRHTTWWGKRHGGVIYRQQRWRPLRDHRVKSTIHQKCEYRVSIVISEHMCCTLVNHADNNAASLRSDCHCSRTLGEGTRGTSTTTGGHFTGEMIIHLQECVIIVVVIFTFDLIGDSRYATA